MASIKQSTVINFSQNNGLGFRLPQPNLQFDNWRNDPSLPSSRQRLRLLIEKYLKQNAVGEFTSEIADLAAFLENQLYLDAASKEDYLNGLTFHDRLRVKIHQKWFEANSAYKNTTSLPMYNAGRISGMPNDTGISLKKSFPGYILAADASIDFVSAGNLNRSQWNAVSGSTERTPDATFQHTEPVIPNIVSPHGGFSGGDPVESGPTFSGSVLQYDSEASFESHRVTQHLPENELNMMRSNMNLSQSHDTSSAATLVRCREGLVQQSTSSNECQSSTSILQCYISYNKDPVLRGGIKIPFLDYIHSEKCNDVVCNCEDYRKSLSHFDNCGSIDCGICGPAVRTYSIGFLSRGLSSDRSISFEDFMSPAKCRKLNSSTPRRGLSCNVSVLIEEPISQQGLQAPVLVDTNPCTPKASMEMSNINACKMTMDGDSGNMNDSGLQGSYSDKVADSCGDLSGGFIEEIKSSIISEKNDIAQNEGALTGIQLEVETGVDKSDKQKVEGITLTEFFTAEEIKLHIASLREKVDQSIIEVVGNATSGFVSENSCQICAGDRLAFPPMPIYCQSCGARIKNFATYYSSKNENRAQICFCTACYNKARGGYIIICGLSILKSNLVMKRNNMVTEESWVQCDKCEGWQHQICALFNDKRDLGGKAEFVCPKCYLEDLESETCMPLPRTAAFDAEKLPRTLLSDHIEQRLFSHLNQERVNRAMAAGMSVEEVPEPANIVVRVVSAVDKILKVKQQFLDIFPENNYPSEFPYRSKVILLFQKIEGVDVCLFAMYVQEFGSKCSPPNQRCIYISYLDSVKYFRPEIKAASGEALRTYVYHEILIGYLDYCKKRGFATCYIWACPPVKGEDYILYCHPETQKTPKPDKLRQWYQLMLKKASKENIVVNFSNLYEKFFVPTGECNTKVTAARLPYFEGDYWSSVAENMIKKIEEEDQQIKVKKIRRRSLKAMGHENPSADDVKDILLMMELGQRISAAKEDFIIVYLQFVCTQCHEVILSGTRWFCGHCKKFQLCQRCHDADPEQGNIHISSSGQKHALTQELVNDVPIDTEDNDDIIDNCFLENRHAFLSFCQGNHYQFDSLRRAKHSSMMILYHLHNPSRSDTGIVCRLCLKDIGADPRWKCDICTEFSVCESCYQRNNGFCHCHTLSQNPPLSASNVLNDNMVKMIRELLDVVRHASQCRTVGPPCSYPNCILIRRLFSHAHSCKIRVSGGCVYCKKTWFVLMLHSRRCKDSNCVVPRCMDLKKYADGLVSQSKAQQCISSSVIAAQTD